MKILIILQVYQGYDAPPSPGGYSREQNGRCWEYFSDSTPDFDSARAVGKQLSEPPGVSNVEVYDVAKWQ